MIMKRIPSLQAYVREDFYFDIFYGEDKIHEDKEQYSTYDEALQKGLRYIRTKINSGDYDVYLV
jgi:hypothetical protein